MYCVVSTVQSCTVYVLVYCAMYTSADQNNKDELYHHMRIKGVLGIKCEVVWSSIWKNNILDKSIENNDGQLQWQWILFPYEIWNLIIKILFSCYHSLASSCKEQRIQERWLRQGKVRFVKYPNLKSICTKITHFYEPRFPSIAFAWKLH